MNVAEDNVIVTYEKGLHARPASIFVQTALTFDSNIRIRTDGSETDAKSGLNVISLGVEPGDEIHIVAEGDDSDEAVAHLVELVQDDFELDEE